MASDSSASMTGRKVRPKWTVMVFMGVETFDGSDPLDEAAEADLQEISSNAGELTRLNGISLYAAHVAFGTDFDAVRGLYDGFVFAKKTVWSRLVHTLAKLS